MAIFSNSSMTGVILDSQNNPLPGASILIKGTTNGTVSDVNGNYRLKKIPHGEQTILISYIGYDKVEENIEFKNGKTLVKNFILKEGVQIKEVVVRGLMKGQSKALNTQKNNVNITNVVSSNQLSKFPDNNIGDALKRIPGINVQYDQGEARFGHIRGTAPEYNSVALNGERVPSAEAEIRSVQLDLVPAEMIQTVEVNKVVTPDMEADAIGGSINLITKSNPFNQKISARVGTGYNFISEDPQILASIMYSNRFKTFGEQSLGLSAAISYQDNKFGSDNIEAEWEKDENDNPFIQEFQIRNYLLERQRQSYSLSLDYKLNADHKIELKGIYNRRKDWENRYRLKYKKEWNDDDNEYETKIVRETKGGTNKDRRLEDQEVMNYSIDGEHHFGILEIDWKASYSKASEDRPEERYISFKKKKVSENLIDATNTKEPIVNISTEPNYDLTSEYGIDDLTEENQYTEEVDKSFKMNFKLPLLDGNYSNKIKFGGKFKTKDKNRDNNFFKYEAKDEDAFVADALENKSDMTKSDFLAGDYKSGNYVSNSYLSSLDLNNSNRFEKEEDWEEYAGNYEAKETVMAGYIRFDQNFGSDLKTIFGVRAEKTDLEYSGRVFDTEEGTVSVTPKEENDYLNILPSFIAKYNLTKDDQFKVAWTNTISRPKYYDLVPHSEVDTKDNKISIGNPNLEPTTSMNFDLMYEHYFSSLGIVSGGFFMKKLKDISNEIEKRDYTYNGTTWDKFEQPINIGDADLYGFEFAFEHQLIFLPSFLKNLGVYVNYTYTKSEQKNINIEGRENEELAMAGTPENNFNVSLFYEDNSLSVRLSMQHADKFIDEWGESAFYDRWYDEVTHLDLNADYTINNKYNIFVAVNNILNSPLRYYQGDTERIMQAEYYGVKASLGMKVNF
jgi:TonB-dependent receptor